MDTAKWENCMLRMLVTTVGSSLHKQEPTAQYREHGVWELDVHQ